MNAKPLRHPASARRWLAFLGGGVVTTAAFPFVPADGGWRPGLFLLAGLVTVAAIVCGRIRYRPTRRRTWTAIGVAHVFEVAAWAGFYAIPALRGLPPAVSPVWNVLFLLVPVAGATGVLMSAGRFRGRDRHAFVDTILFTIGFGVLSWVLLISQYAHAGGFSLPVRMVSVAYLLSNMVLLGAAARLAFTVGSHPRAVLLLGWTVGHLVGNALYSAQALQGTFELGGPVFATWILSYAFLGAAALHPSAPGPAALTARRPSRFRNAVLVAAVAPLPVLLVVRSLQQSLDDVAVIAAGSVIVAVLVATRLVLATPRTVSAEVRRTLRRSTTRLVAAFALLAFLPLASLAYLGVHESHRTLEHEVRDRMMSVAEASGNYVDERVGGIEALVLAYADRPSLIATLSSPTPDLAQVQRHLVTLQGAHPDLYASMILDPKGTLIATAPDAPEVLGKSFAHRDYFTGAMRADRGYVSSAFIAARNGHPRAVGVSSAVRDEHGRILGVLAVGYRLDGIRAFADRLARAQHVTLTLTDQTGTVLAGAGSSATGLPSAAGDARVAAALRGQSATTSTQTADGRVLSSYRPVSSHRWAVLAETPERVAFAAQERLAARIVAVAVLLGQVMLVGLVCAIRSERARREVAAQLGEREEHVRGIIEAAGDAFIAIDGAGRVTEWNAQAGTIFGHRREDAMGAELAALIIPEAQRAAHRNGMTRVLGGGEARLLDRRIEVTAQRADGTEFPAELTLWGTYKSGGRSFNAFVRDVTDRKRQDAEIAAARDAAIEASRLKSEFVANMSHEIRTPMNGVLGMTTLLLDTDLDLVQRDYAETAANSAEALLTVVNDILDFSKIEAGKLDIEDTDFLLRPLAEEVAALLAPAAQAKGLEVTALVDPDVPAAVRGDPHRLRQVVTNLLGNAVKFTEHGEVAFRVSTVEGGGIRLTVRDTGIGISPEHGRRLFEAFSQADASTTRRYGGTGLGLTISRQLVELMGGTLDFTSTEGAGTTFWADLPLPAVAAPAVSAPVRRCPTDARVLVVDDNATNRKVLEQFLGSWSLEPHCVADGRTALEDLRSAAEAGTPFDAVILDMHMPGMSGVDVAKAVLADPDLAGTPLAVLTSTNDQGEAAGARKAGVGVYLTKPVREAQLYEGLSRLLGGRTTSPTPSTAAAPRPRPDTRLLVAEDNTVNQQVLVAMLGVLGYDADVAVDGRHALELFAVGDYAAVLMDCQMPRLDGYAATRELRALGGRGAAVPVIALTASARADDEQRCREAGMDDFVTKPLRPETLACILDRWVGADGVAAARPVPAGAAEPTGPLDRETLDELAALGPDLVRGVVTAFLATVPDRLTELRAAVARQDVAAVRGLVHGVRGSAGHVGATALVEVLARLENDDGAEAVEHLAAVEAELARVTTALHDVLAG